MHQRGSLCAGTVGLSERRVRRRVYGVEIERNFLNRREKAVTAYYGFEEETWGGEAHEDDPLFE